jgi:hypothetical protein
MGGKKKDRGKKGRKSGEQDYEDILQAEDTATGKVPVADDADTMIRSDDKYLQSLKEKMQAAEASVVEESEEPTPPKPVKHTFVDHKKEEAEPESGELELEPEDIEETTLPPRGRRSKGVFPFSDKTTQKLEEEVRKGSSEESEPPPPTFRSEQTSWHGNSVYVLCGPDAGKSFYITSEKIKIGRGLDNDVVLKDISVSRRHCIIIRDGEKWRVEDKGSDNGTYLDGKPVRTSEFRPGQYLQLGRTILVVESI